MLPSSYQKALNMVEEGDKYVLDGPIIEGRKVSWLVKSQNSESLAYNVTITPNLLMTYRSSRECYKNFVFKCTCEDFKVIVSICVELHVVDLNLVELQLLNQK